MTLWEGVAWVAGATLVLAAVAGGVYALLVWRVRRMAKAWVLGVRIAMRVMDDRRDDG